MTKISLKQTEEFYEFLQGNLPEGIYMKPRPKLSQRRAFDVIWYLQEHLRLIPSNYERCCSCGDLYDSDNSGGHKKDRCYCDNCLVWR